MKKGSKRINHYESVGKTINYLTVLSVRSVRSTPRVRKYEYLCLCKCGRECYIDALRIYHKKQISCGCYAKEKMKYKISVNKIPAYKAWYAMMSRCYDKNQRSYKWWGGRGIAVCERWHNIDNFIEDMGYGEKGLSLDRRDNNKNYEPSNCRWATKEEQSNNTSRTKKYLIQGILMTREDISLIFGVSRKKIQYYELEKGQNIYQILNI